MKPAVHDPRHGDGSRLDTGEIYDLSQTCTCDCTTSGYEPEEHGFHSIKDGDVLLCQWRGQRVDVVMVSAWPTAIDPLSLEDGMVAYEMGDEADFRVHRLETAADWELIEDGKYLPSVEVASEHQG